MFSGKIIIDANFIIALVGNEEYTPQVKNIYSFMKKGKVDIYAPTFILIEILNVLVNKKKTSIGFAKNTLKRIKGSGLVIVDMDNIIKETNQLEDVVFKYNITSYDGLYILLAKQKKCKLLTADKELLKIKDLTIDLRSFKLESNSS